MSWTLVLTSRFKKGYKNKTPELSARVDDAIRRLAASSDPRSLGRSKHGDLRNCYGYDIDSRNRLLYSFDPRRKELYLLRVCSHKEVY